MRKSLGGTSLCTMKPSKRHERWLEVLACATSSTHKSTLSSVVCHGRPKSFVFASGKPCNRPRIAIMCSAWSDQLLNSRNGRRGEVHLAHGLHHEIHRGVHRVEILCSRRQHIGRHQVAAALCPER